jgi:hypothetical protein
MRLDVGEQVLRRPPGRQPAFVGNADDRRRDLRRDFADARHLAQLRPQGRDGGDGEV